MAALCDPAGLTDGDRFVRGRIHHLRTGVDP